MAPCLPIRATRRERRRVAPAALLVLILAPFLPVRPPAGALQTAPSGEPPAAVREALARIRRNDFEGAIRVLETARGGAEVSADVLSMLGGLYIQQGRVAEAFEILAPLASRPGADPLVLFDAARAAFALGKTAEAESFLTASVGKAPLSRAALMLGELRAEQGRHKEAAALFLPLTEGPGGDRLAESDPDLAAEIHRRLADAWIASGEPETAAAPLRRLTELRPEDPEAWRKLGETLVELERFDEAQTALTRVQDLEETQRRTEIEEAEARKAAPRVTVEDLLLAAGEQQRAGRLEKALETVRRAIETDPEDLRPRTLEIRALISLKRLEEAGSHADMLVNMTAEDPEALYLRGMVALAKRDLPAAEADLRRVVEAVPDHLAGLNGLAMALMARGEKEEARSLLTRVLESWPNDPLARSNLEKLR